jgi:hypothetical protein
MDATVMATSSSASCMSNFSFAAFTSPASTKSSDKDSCAQSFLVPFLAPVFRLHFPVSIRNPQSAIRNP